MKPYVPSLIFCEQITSEFGNNSTQLFLIMERESYRFDDNVIYFNDSILQIGKS